MRGISTAVAVAVLALVAVSPGAASTGPALRVEGMQPLVVRGVGFHPGERIALTAMALRGSRQMVVRATRAGRFAASFRLPTQSCGSPFAFRAVGTLGSRVTLRLPSRPCVPPPIR
ncbi:MAG TPA: hypothetical protein VL264_00330 [Gaiella sp.]|jgi:hypothetical protein|nr:hypothetical protein [Gaiella sp.]